MKHLSNETIYDYFDNELDDIEKQEIKAHLLECDLCHEEFKNIESLKAGFKKIVLTDYKDNEFVSIVMQRVLDVKADTSKTKFFSIFENWLIPVCSFSCAIFILLNNNNINYTDKPQNILLASEETSDISEFSLENLLGRSDNEGWL